MVIEEDLEGGNDDSEGDGYVGVRDGGCCRIRRRPDTPSPCSCSGMRGDLCIESRSMDDPASMEKRIRVPSAGLMASAKRFPVLRFLGRERTSGGGGDGDLCSMGVDFERLEEPRLV